MDWSVFVDKTNGELFWEEDLLPVLKKIGMYKYAQIMTKTGSMYFNTVCPNWCQSAEEDLCDDVMRDILAGGNKRSDEATKKFKEKFTALFLANIKKAKV